MGVGGRLFKIVRLGRGGFQLAVNFGPQIIPLFKEARNLLWVGFQVPHAITNMAKDAKRVYPHAVSLMETASLETASLMETVSLSYRQYDPLSLSWLLYMHRIGLLDWEWKPRVFPCLSFGGQEYVVRTTTLLAAGSGGPTSSLRKSSVKETPPSSTLTPKPTRSAMS
ncbi:uncharacterized protein LACBIDRAFT_306517 [Laccaria bicolor S238N-H82]|uniref:Predicted protein n=1 Tax=Laccaria bicolor (strain S238N-H82 / ATCC MYA-4686) TaxID=486041 RepID=B0DN83_LACBS|nr:uncharacterized protein LACBIDRAFT_306517 [Laccaria bicolor S238N-H82]EDR03829.1 predicted protein [Laccaria bicolor S238N-H82]|eukprot:XP_001885397.1 predicted protein [Laccaria bicolor S238N-H82]